MRKNIIVMLLKKLNRTGRIFLLPVLFILLFGCIRNPQPTIVQFVYTSDSHFGITRTTFQGDSNVYANVVNAAMVKKINSLTGLTLPNDFGVNAGKNVGGIDYLINTGDIANRSEKNIQKATDSWQQFVDVYLNGLTTKNNSEKATKIWLLPGNHDVSNAIGHYHISVEKKDNASMVGIYNHMFATNQKTDSSFNFHTNKIHYSKDITGLHFIFVQMWPDSCERIWMEEDLKSVSDSTPVLLFTHDEPNVEAKHFTNPNGNHDINTTDKFENLLGEVFKDGKDISISSDIEQREFAAFLKKHRNIKIYFHGNDNENRYYTYHGPDNDVNLKIIQVDSPMKGNYSSTSESKLSFQLVTINIPKKELTVRECLWNKNPTHPELPVVWGESTTISLK